MKNQTFRAIGTMIVLALTAGESLAQSIYEPYTFTTFARGADESGVAVDSAGNVYVTGNAIIQKVTPTGVMTTLAGLAGNSGSADGI